jgi:hypothetical protein
MTYKHRYYENNGTVKYRIELHNNGHIYPKPDSYAGDLYLKALAEDKVESYTTDPLLTDDFQLVPQYDEIMIERENERIRQARQSRYQQEVDPLMFEKLSDNYPELKVIKDKIRKELPYESIN